MVIFISPILIKSTHFLYIHHDNFSISFSKKPVVSTKHKKCLICAFKFVEFISNALPQNYDKPKFFLVYYIISIQSVCIAELSYTFNLRAPPVI